MAFRHYVTIVVTRYTKSIIIIVKGLVYGITACIIGSQLVTIFNRMVWVRTIFRNCIQTQGWRE